MRKRTVSKHSLEGFKIFLEESEKSEATVKKYLHDVEYFLSFAAKKPPTKALMLQYKSHLKERYALRSANSMLASLNSFLRFCERYDLCLKQFRVQAEAFCSKEKELTRGEYTALVRAAEQKKSYQLSLIVQTICATGIRVSELKYITVEAVINGEAEVCCKGKSRRILIVNGLRKRLGHYIKKQGISEGSVFVTKNGRPLDRSNIWRQMKELCLIAGVSSKKVFPHNLRHLFARTFYAIERDIAKLADLLGHSSINTTRIYIMTTSSEHRRLMETMRLVI